MMCIENSFGVDSISCTDVRNSSERKGNSLCHQKWYHYGAILRLNVCGYDFALALKKHGKLQSPEGPCCREFQNAEHYMVMLHAKLLLVMVQESFFVFPLFTPNYRNDILTFNKTFKHFDFSVKTHPNPKAAPARGELQLHFLSDSVQICE